MTPVVQVPKVEPNSGEMETVTLTQGGLTPMMLQSTGDGQTQVLQVLSLKDATVLTKAMGIADVKTEETIIGDQG